jgi:hypothetical protein
MAAERLGIPAVANTCEGFVPQAKATASLGGEPWLNVVNYPGHIDLYTLEERNKYIAELVAPGNDAALTTQIPAAASAPSKEPPMTDVAFTGTFEEVNQYYKEKMWSDGLPIVPPTKEKIDEFLKFTDYPADAILGRPVPPSYREATPWWVAVNGVMAGCRPEYMPVLIAMTKAWSEQNFGAQDSSSTPGWAPIAFINGPIKQQIGLNFRHNYGTPGYQSNTSIGRFWNFFKRNLLEIRIEPPTDMGTHGLNPFLPGGENDEVVHGYGWATLAEQQGFNYGDNVVTVMSVSSVTQAPTIDGSTGDALMAAITGKLAEGQGAGWRLTSGDYLFVVTELVGQVLARDGWNKDTMQQYVYENAKLPAFWLETRFSSNGLGYFCKQVAAGAAWARPEYCQSEDPNRLIPMFRNKAKIWFVVGGDEARNRMVMFMNNGDQGPVTSVKIELPKNWDALMAASDLPALIKNSISGAW